MSETYTRSVFWSALVHGLAFALIFIASLVAQRLAKPEPKVFELVAGEGDNFRATEAPAAQLPVQKQPERLPPAVQVPTPQPTPPPPKQQPKSEPKTVAPPPKAEPKVPVMNYSEFLKQNPIQEPKQAPPRTVPVPKIDPKTATRGGTAPSTAQGAGGTALTTQMRNELEQWYALLTLRLRQNLVRPEGVSDSLVAGVQLSVTAEGGLTGQVVRSSGNPAFDRAVNEAIRRVSLLGMPPKPDRRAETVTLDFRMIDAPSN